MKHVFAFLLALFCLFAVVRVSYTLGHGMGVKHVLEDSEMRVLAVGDDGINDGYNVRIMIDLDGNLYEHFARIG